jgi:hypothetical protein
LKEVKKKRGDRSPLREIFLRLLYYISVRVTAPEGHTLVQVWQPSQSPALAAEALPSTMSKTLTGQLLEHSSHPSHFEASTDTKYIVIPPLFFYPKPDLI